MRRTIAQARAAELGAILPRAERALVLRGFAAAWPAVRETAGMPVAEAMRWLGRTIRECTAGAPLLLPAEFGGTSYLEAEHVSIDVARFADALARRSAEAGGADAGARELPYLAQASIFDASCGGRPALAAALMDPLPFEQPPFRVAAWLGSRTISPLHRDPYHNLLVQAIGSKEVLTLEPGSHGIYPFPRSTLQHNTSQVDVFDPDLGQFPGFEERLAEASSAVLHPGDALVIPKGFWHAVRATSSASLSINFWWAGPVHDRSSSQQCTSTRISR